MVYKEYQAAPYFSQHIECYWEMALAPYELDNPYESLPPDCTFDVVFSSHPFYIRSLSNNTWKTIFPGATFLGQKTNSVNFAVQKPVIIFGVRFKPFAFANIIKKPLFQLNDQALSFNELFNLNTNNKKTVQAIILNKDVIEKIKLSEELFFSLLEQSFPIDQNLRAQLNYIMDRKGVVKIKELFSIFGVSKVTLHKHFVNKMGLTPKKVCRIWRINYFLELQKKYPNYNLTELCLEAGFYDQAHFIKEFKAYFGTCPHRFFKRDNQLIRISQETIIKRFTNQYDPR